MGGPCCGIHVAPPFPVRLGIGVDAVTLAAGTLQSVRGDLKLDGDDWDIETLELRAPGFAQIRLTFDVDTDAPQEKLDQLLKLTERYCVVYQTISKGTACNAVMQVKR